MTDFLFLGFKITAGGDYSHEVRRRLLLGRKAMTNPDSVLKSRDITLLTKVHIVNAMVFPVVTYSCESWTIKRQNTKELMPSNCGAGEDSWKSLGQQWDQTSQSSGKSTLTTLWKNWCWSWSSSILVKWCKWQLIGKTQVSGKDWGQKEKDEMAGWNHQCNGHELGQTLGVGEGQGGLVNCSPWGLKESDMTGWLNNNNEL